MKLFQSSLRLFFKNKFLTIAFLLLTVGSCCYPIAMAARHSSFNDGQDALTYLENTLQMALIFFVFFLYISFAYFSKLKDVSLEEWAKTTKKGIFSVYASQFAVLLFLVTGLFAVLLVINLAIALMRGGATGEYFLQVLSNLVTSFLLAPMIAALVGMCCSLCKKKINAYFLMIIFILLTSPLTEMVAGSVYMSNEFNLFPVTDWFVLYPRWVSETIVAFGMPVAAYQWQRLITWLLLLAGVACFALPRKKDRKKGWAVGTICLAFCLGFGTMASMPASKIISGPNPANGQLANAYHYIARYGGEEPIQKEEKADFAITKYKLDFTIKRQLQTKAELTLSKTDLREYRFTLFHGYHIKSISDQNGKALEFQQAEDYFSVKNDGVLERLTLVYAGSSEKYYSSGQGVFLPGNFPYYPTSGYHKVYDVVNQGLYPIVQEEPVPFEVTIATPGEVHCSLPQNDDGTFSGVTNGVSITGGLLEVEKTEGIEIVYPYLDTQWRKAYIEKGVFALKEKGFETSAYQKVFAIPNVNLTTQNERFYRFTDHIIICSMAQLQMM